MIEVQVGDNLYAPLEGWSGQVIGVFRDDDTDEPWVAVLWNHDPGAMHPVFCIPIDGYRVAKPGEQAIH